MPDRPGRPATVYLHQPGMRLRSGRNITSIVQTGLLRARLTRPPRAKDDWSITPSCRSATRRAARAAPTPWP